MKVVWRDSDGVSHDVTGKQSGHGVEVKPCSCGCNLIGGDGKRIAPDDWHYEADAYCLGCKARRGIIEAWLDTLFGLHEDEAVLEGRCRVY